jgi:demethylmenaquinone methyltransferase/2-methoxy-6-polyprenyl-1,4-benzoquinol methylase
LAESKARKADTYEATLAEQRAYYEARAPEYDEWWQREGRYHHDNVANARWFAEIHEVKAAFDAAGLGGDIVELAPGTGNWTEPLARIADHVTALDASPQMMELNRQRLATAGLADRVSFKEVDLFAWRPERAYDAAFMGFFLSHVPDERLDSFLQTVVSAVRRGGIIFFVDSRPEPTSSTADQPLPTPENPIMTRRLNDGQSFQIVKIYRSAAEMQAAFARQGVEMVVGETPNYFQYGRGILRPA